MDSILDHHPEEPWGSGENPWALTATPIRRNLLNMVIGRALELVNKFLHLRLGSPRQFLL